MGVLVSVTASEESFDDRGTFPASAASDRRSLPSPQTQGFVASCLVLWLKVREWGADE
jgi:hypothetical protein